jgi:hypothetical protein
MHLSSLHVLTPPCRLSFPSLFTPTLKFAGLADTPENKAFQATLLIPPDVDLAIFTNALEAAMHETWGKSIEPKFPVIRACAGKETSDGKPYAGYADGWHYIRAANRKPPQVVDQALQPVLGSIPAGAGPEEKAAAFAAAESRVFAGCWCRFLLRAYGWTNQGRGVSFSLEAVQLVREDERLGGGAVDARNVFEPVDVGVDAPTSDAKPAENDALRKLLG